MMNQFRRILVYAESGNADALKRVVDLAERNRADLTICDVIDSPPVQSGQRELVARLNALSWQLALERLRALAAPYRSRISLDYVVLSGIPFLAVTEQVVRQGFDLVVHICDGNSSVCGDGLSSTGMHLIRKCPCAVWVENPGIHSGSANLVLSVDRDFHESRNPAETLARELAQMATIVASAGSTLHVVHAWKPFAESLLQLEDACLTLHEAEIYLDSLERDYRQWMAGLTECLSSAAPGLTIHPHLVRGAVAPAIEQVVRETDAGLILMGTVGTSDIPGVLIGPNAEAILQTTETPVLALKPRGFSTPLQFTGRPRENSTLSASQ